MSPNTSAKEKSSTPRQATIHFLNPSGIALLCAVLMKRPYPSRAILRRLTPQPTMSSTLVQPPAAVASSQRPIDNQSTRHPYPPRDDKAQQSQPDSPHRPPPPRAKPSAHPTATP